MSKAPAKAEKKDPVPGMLTGMLAPLPVKPAPWLRVSDQLLMATSAKPAEVKAARQALFGATAFSMPELAPGVIPKGNKIAMDEQVLEINAWAANQAINGAFYNGVVFMGYTYLSELAQISEYRRIVEVTATEMTRKWIIFKGGTKTKIKDLTAEGVRLDVQGNFRKMSEGDGFFGRMHLYIDTGDTDNVEELKKPLGNGRDSTSKLKLRKGFLKALRPVEPVWCYPADYTSNDPLKGSWYKPQSWFCMGKQIHSSRFMTFVGREVPDMLKPSYSFGGMSLSQMAKPYIDNWLRTRQAIADLIWTFSVSGLETDLQTINADGGDELLKRAALFSNLRTNQGLMMIQKDVEKFFNVSTPLSTLDALQSQAQEHMCSVIGIPVVKLLGIQPAGLNASSEGELTTWYDWVAAFQEKFFSDPLDTIIQLMQINLWGEVDPTITWEFEQLRELTEKELAEVNKVKADTDVALVSAGILAPEESRERLENDPNSGYDNINPDDIPEGQPINPEDENGNVPNLSDMMSRLGVRDPQARKDGDEEEGDAPRNAERDPTGARTEPRGSRARGGRAREPREFDQAA